MFGYSKRIKELEDLVYALRTDLNHVGKAQRDVERVVKHANLMTVPRVRDGEKVEPNKSGGYPGSYREHLREISIASAVHLLADKLDVELVYEDDMPGELRVVGIAK